MKKMHRMKRARAVAMVVAFCLLTGIITNLSGTPTEVKAESDQNARVSYATREELLDQDYFSLAAGKEGVAKKVYFGVGTDGELQGWYIAGKDWVEESLILVCDPERPLAEQAVFYSGSEIRIRNPNDPDPFYGEYIKDDGLFVRKIYPYHYGGSEIRNVVLKELERSSHFSQAEQNNMKSVDVATTDGKTIIETNTGGNTSLGTKAVYITSDSLYLGAGIQLKNHDRYFEVGSYVDDIRFPLSGGVEVSLSEGPYSDFPAENNFWMRESDAPDVTDEVNFINDMSSDQQEGKVVNGYPVSESLAVVPVMHLDTTSVHFGADAPAISSEGVFELNDAFTIRYEEKALGTVVISRTGEYIGVSNAPPNTYLVLQTENKVWSKKVEGNTIISRDEVVIDGNEVSDFTRTYIWLEAAEEGRIAKASMGVGGYSVQIIPGSNMTKLEETGENHQIVSRESEITGCAYKADEGYYIPEDYNMDGALDQHGIRVYVDGDVVRVEGVPTADMVINLTGATQRTDDPEPEIRPQIIEAIKKWVKGNKDRFYFRSDADFSEFLHVTIDGEELDPSNYDAEEGSILVTLKAAYLDTLTPGTHTIGIVSKNGTAETTFTIKESENKSASDKTTVSAKTTTSAKTAASAKTGDTSQLSLWIIVLIVCGGFATFGIIWKCKRKTK